MSGHSKWANIKHRKAAQDAKRGKQFTKLIKEITVCARTEGGDPMANARLRQLIDKAKNINMPSDNVTRAIKKGTGELPGAQYESIMYEGYGPYGIAILVDVLTDNKNRTVAEMRHIFSNKGGSLAESGAVIWMFEKLGVVRVSNNNISEDALLEQLLEYEIKDITVNKSMATITCNPKSLEHIKISLQGQGYTIESADLEWVANNTTSLQDNASEKALDFLHTLDDHDDVQNVFTNLVS